MPDFRVVWHRPESHDRREQEVIVQNQASSEHAVWEAARQVFLPEHPSSMATTQSLVRVEQLTES